MISRDTVVWRPRRSFSRTAPVSCTSLPANALTRLDFPAPLLPISTAVAPGGMNARSWEKPLPSTHDNAMTCTDSPAQSETSRQTRSISCWSCAMSAFVSATTTRAPVSCASTSSRSRRFLLSSGSGCATIITSKFAASVCEMVRSAGSRRTNAF